MDHTTPFSSMSASFMPHGMCYLWQPGVLALHVISDALITLAYFSIPFTLVYFVRKRRDLQFNWMFVCFAVFIVACGMTHLMEIWVVWRPYYWLSGSIKAVTATASVPTAILLVRLIPQALRLPSPSALQEANTQLQRQMAERERAEAVVRRLNGELEARVRERTHELESANAALQSAYEELRQTQRTVMQQERLRALGQMASGIAHDINNAISPISLYAEALLEREPGLSVPGRRQIETIQRAIDDVANTVARMREFYRSRESEAALTQVDLNRIAGQVAELTRARWTDLPQREGIVIDLRMDTLADLPKITGAEHELRDALINLVFNAVDAMPDGGVLTLATSAGTSQGDNLRHACIEVRDTGVGMDENTRRSCLEPFFTTKGERGTGLGLAMVYGMVQRHGAQLDIHSEPGHGTTVRIVFPPPKPLSASAPHAAAPPRHAAPLRVLIVDDDAALLKALHDALRLDGHHITVADGGQAGIDACGAAERAGQPFDIVITDLGMPYVDGHKVARAVRAQSPGTPIVMLTGWGQQAVAEHNTPGHVDRVLSKPPKLHELRAVLAELAGKRSLAQQKF